MATTQSISLKKCTLLLECGVLCRINTVNYVTHIYIISLDNCEVFWWIDGGVRDDRSTAIILHINLPSFNVHIIGGRGLCVFERMFYVTIGAWSIANINANTDRPWLRVEAVDVHNWSFLSCFLQRLSRDVGLLVIVITPNYCTNDDTTSTRIGERLF
jgi:hypothetical protein